MLRLTLKKKSIKENARFHKRQEILLSLDVKKFFDSITSDKVYKVFSSLGYQEDIVVMLTNLCCLNGCLPQGAPTSPIISNIILKKFDDEVGKFTNEKKIRYTRYADDMTFSGDFNPGQIISFVKNRLYELGLKLNEEKTRTRKKSQRQEVTGIVVNEKMQLPKSVRRKDSSGNILYKKIWIRISYAILWYREEELSESFERENPIWIIYKSV